MGNKDKRKEKKTKKNKKKDSTKLRTSGHADICSCFKCNGNNMQLVPTVIYVRDKNGKNTTEHAYACKCYSCNNKKGKQISFVKKDNTPPCHVENALIFEKDDVILFGGGNMRGARPEDVDIVIDLDNNVDSVWSQNIPSDFSCKEFVTGPQSVLYLTISDFSTPDVGKDFWNALWKDLKAKAPVSVLVMCQGGHGRTGLVATCLIMAAEFNVGEENPITWLRDNYCEKAVESQAQLKYLGDMWDIPYVKESKPAYGYGYLGGGGHWAGDDDYTKTGYDKVEDSDTCYRKCGSEGGTVAWSDDIEEHECDNCWERRNKTKLDSTEEVPVDYHVDGSDCFCTENYQCKNCEAKSDDKIIHLHGLTNEAWETDEEYN